MSIQAVNKYLSSNVQSPFFLVVGDAQYTSIKDKLLELGLTIVRVSDYCSSHDALPDIDGLLERLKTAKMNAGDSKLVVVGLGEYLALRGNHVSARVLSQLKDLNTGTAKAVLLLRGVAAQVNELQADPRFDSRRCCIVDTAICNLSLTLAVPPVVLSGLVGIKALLKKLENGECGNIVVNTTVSLENSSFTVHRINDAYDGIKHISIDFNLPRSCGSDEQWAELLTELTQHSSLDAVFEKNGLADALEADFYVRVAGLEYRNWLYFIALKSKSDTLSNDYLRFVLEYTDRFEDFKTNVLSAISQVPHKDKQFGGLYADRKLLIEKFPEPDVASFIINNRKNAAESVYRLTDGTKAEREEIIAWVSRHGVIPQIADIYPALTDYLKTYVFDCGDLSDLLTEYFDAYKRQKVSNALETDFLQEVDKLASSREYNRLPTRNEIIDGLDKDDTYLYWLDALGVEYLAFISKLARERGLSISINVARASLPTITSINRDFFDAWRGSRKVKDDELDDTKHSDVGGYNFENNELPIHLARELEIISGVIDKAATELAQRHHKRFLIVSDHGASRLAVLRRKEEKYDTDTKGEHSGRCCKSFEPYDLPFAAEENGYLVLADYGRFRGSRASNVEVHGGASLEEVLVPIIELTLKDSNMVVELAEEFVTVDFRTGTEITLFVNSPVKDMSLVLSGKRYLACMLDGNHYKVALPDTKRAGEYHADVYSGDDLIGKILIKAQGKSGKANEAFDGLF
ncbi:MAG: BREX-4 system phosphatase PglZ [Armatimonadetes bacterium]|nr:BREX-4 system phosphatase PglZ [Armatimonadota bacterium]